MPSLNRVTLIGHLGQDPELRYTPNGNAAANFSLATNEKWKDKKTGQDNERTEWHKIVVWGKTAEICKEHLSKGQAVYIEGRLQTRKWEDKTGQARYTTEVVADQVLFLGGKGEKAAGGQTGMRATYERTARAPAPQHELLDDIEAKFGAKPTDEDIPF